MEYKKLRNGLKVSAVGFGTYPLRVDQIFHTVPRLSEYGINLVDTAHDYRNEQWIGLASKVRKERLVISTKMSVAQQRDRKFLGGGVYQRGVYAEP